MLKNLKSGLKVHVMEHQKGHSLEHQTLSHKVESCSTHTHAGKLTIANLKRPAVVPTGASAGGGGSTVLVKEHRGWSRPLLGVELYQALGWGQEGEFLPCETQIREIKHGAIAQSPSPTRRPR